MIYFDNASMALPKPETVAEAMAVAVRTLGNAAPLATTDDPARVAFTSGATESLNRVLASLLQPEDAVITSVLEHNAVLRPLPRVGMAAPDALDDLRTLVGKGTKVRACGTCLNDSRLIERLAVGEITDRMGITQRLAAAGRLLTL